MREKMASGKAMDIEVFEKEKIALPKAATISQFCLSLDCLS